MQTQKTVLITGASGFIGSALCTRLTALGLPIRKVLRTVSNVDCTNSIIIPATHESTVWGSALSGCDTVIHLAGIVHRSGDYKTYLNVNVNGSLNLATQAALAGVKRFIFMSSIAVNGANSLQGKPFTAQSIPNPVGTYGLSKLEAEQGLRKIAAETGMEVVIIRPPIVYGPGVKANFFSMMRFIDARIPLPFGGVTENRRSLVSLDNLISLLVVCIDHPAAANQIFMVSDNEDLSTRDLLYRLSRVMGRHIWLPKIPQRIFRIGARMFGRDDLVQRLLGNLEIDITHTLKTLGWVPPISVDEGLRRAASGFCLKKLDN